MTYPPPSGGWQDPLAAGQQSSPPADPMTPMAGNPIPTQPTSADPYASPDPYAGMKSADPYAAAGYPPGAYPQPGGYPSPAGYPGYGYAPGPKQNGLAIGAMIVSIIGALGLCGYGLGGYIGLVGAILGHVSRKQIRERGEGGEGFATAGIIVGWISTALAVLATAAFVILIIWAANQDSSGYGSTNY
ncbi:DUF4190 domain-containing protein [Micromonospora sp. WMMA1949]|uniref:DUF4190 domain-containing protein n=1 Tax=unclassified Micromonospora TaxID=2617518 RepID=UPI0022B66D5A|nr:MULTISPECIES: DUF4190 domain-containing protein [unclassified Micromonospora]MCZ7425930.1 DUF4190 domain-containing protein [Micromonospora sp. WMMA1949]WBC10446.1 DUF4190 domain-containing protein [Micromonospora sp. WMMA1947]